MLTQKQTYTAIAVLAGAAFVAFTIPFFTFHKGLPTGDSQKSIIWAEEMLQSGQLPNYQEAIPRLNRDPVDFYTPVLHVLTAGFLAVGGLPALGVSAIVFSLITAAVAAALAYHVLPAAHRPLGAIITFILVLTQERFLRYVREPGYHYQNIVGELLLFGVLLLGLHLLERWRWRTFVIMIAATILLILTHQFSAFLGFFMAFPLVVALAFRYRRAAAILIPFVAAFLLVAIPLGLHEKIPHIFTAHPHLLSQTPGLLRTLSLMGAPWITVGIFGLLLLIKEMRGNLFRIAFVASTGMLIVLSQGPRFGVDIPPIRALFYAVIPLSITGAYLVSALWQQARGMSSKAARIACSASLIIFLAVFAGSSASRAFALSHTLRTNSTLTPGELELVDYLKQQNGGILVDDYNRRSASWLVLAGQPMFTRIAADLETQMNEARQSPLRYQLYLNQLDFEKIFSLGSRAEIIELMKKHNITWLTGIDGSSVSHFSHNPALEKAKKVDDITLFKLSERSRTDFGDLARGVGLPSLSPAKQDEQPMSSRSQNLVRLEASDNVTQWLLKPSTLANDLGDLEDTYEHLPASLRATRVSEPKAEGNTTFRTTNAPLIPITFNVGDYVRVLWDQDKNGEADSALELVVQLTNSPSSLTLVTPRGTEFPLSSSDKPVKISAADAPINKDGFITFVIKNPDQQALSFDLIALGLAHTP